MILFGMLIIMIIDAKQVSFGEVEIRNTLHVDLLIYIRILNHLQERIRHARNRIIMHENCTCDLRKSILVYRSNKMFRHLENLKKQFASMLEATQDERFARDYFVVIELKFTSMRMSLINFETLIAALYRLDSTL